MIIYHEFIYHEVTVLQLKKEVCVFLVGSGRCSAAFLYPKISKSYMRIH